MFHFIGYKFGNRLKFFKQVNFLIAGSSGYKKIGMQFFFNHVTVLAQHFGISRYLLYMAFHQLRIGVELYTVP